MHSHLGVGIHYLGLPGNGALYGRLDAVLRSMSVAGQRVGHLDPAGGSIFVGRRPGGLTTMRRVLESFDPHGRLVSPMRTSVIEETENPR